MAKIVKAELEVNITVDCPHCESVIDLEQDLDMNDDGYLYKNLMPDGEIWTSAHERFIEEIDCPFCDEPLLIKGVIY